MTANGGQWRAQLVRDAHEEVALLTLGLGQARRHLPEAGRVMRRDRYQPSSPATMMPPSDAIASRCRSGISRWFNSVFGFATIRSPNAGPFGSSFNGRATARYVLFAPGGLNSNVIVRPE